MLEFLFNFLERNIILVFLCVLTLGIASVYSKGIKFLFISILSIVASYFAFLCLYRLGYGIEFLYHWSCKYVIRICYLIDYYSFICLNHSILFTKLFDILFYSLHTHENILLYLIHFFGLIILIVNAIDIIIPRIKLFYLKKIKIKLLKINKKSQIYNTISKVQSKFILNSVFRC